MADRTVSVKISGPALSQLLFENVNAHFKQEGFLLGNVTTTVTKLVTDDWREDVRIQDIININGVVPCDLPHMYYRSNGELVEDKLNEMLGEQNKNVLAWFKYKKHRKLGLRFTILERMLHEELMRFFDISPHIFTCCVLSCGKTNRTISDNKSTKVFTHAFINMQDTKLKMIPIDIENLGDPCHVYKPNTRPSESFMKVYKSVNKNQSDMKIGIDIHNQLQLELKNSITDLASSEHKLCQLREEINALTKAVKKAALASNALTKEENSNITECKKIEIEVPITENNKNALNSGRNNETDVIEIVESGPENEELEQKHEESLLDTPVPGTTTSVVDLTLSDEEEKPARKIRSQSAKTGKNKRGARNH